MTSTLKADVLTSKTTNGDLSISGDGSGVPDLEAGFKVGSVAGVPTASIRDDAVTLAKMASGTDGQIITYDASGNPTAVGPGSDGEVLTSTGAGSPPAFEAVSSSFPSPNFTSSEQTVTLDNTLNVAHGLGSVPNLWTVVLRNKTTQAGWSVGDELAFSDWGDSAHQGATVNADATNVTVVTGHNLVPHNQTSKDQDTVLTVGYWKWVVRAWS